MSKILDSAVELNKIQYIAANNSLNFTATPITGGSAIVDATAGVYANGAFAQANAAFNSANNVAPQIQPAFDTANGAYARANLSAQYDANTISTGYFAVPFGNTASRPANPQIGSVRYNTTNNAGEMYIANGWVEFAARSPSLSNVSPTAFSGDSGTTFSIYGLNFTQDVQVYFLLANNFPVLSSSVSYVNSSLIQATTPRAFTVAEETLGVRVVQTSGSAAILNAIDCGVVPTWNTASGTVATHSFSNSSNLVVSTYQFDAYDPDNTSVTYTLSGNLPLNLSLQSNGAITGTVTVPTASSVTNNFSVIVTDGAGNQTTRAFSIVRRWLDGSTSALAGTSANAIKQLTGTTTSGLFWIKPPTWTYPAQFYCEMSRGGGGWTYVVQTQCVNNAGITSGSLTGASGSHNQGSANFYGVIDSNGTQKSISDIWDAFIGSTNLGKIYAREIQTSGGSYDEYQYYVSNTDGSVFTKTNFSNMFAGNFASGYGASSTMYQTIKVNYSNGASSVTGKSLCSWGTTALMTINNSAIDQELYWCNGNGSDANWGFALMKGGTPYPRLADANNGGGRNSITRWAIMAIKE